MCGIFALICSTPIVDNKYKSHALSAAQKLKHRGPDGTGFYKSKYVWFAHTRLSIIDPTGGNQPFVNNNDSLILCVNGEIFNYKELKNEFPNYNYKTKSDCEPLLALYSSYSSYASYESSSSSKILTHKQISELLGKLDGQFSFILHDTNTNMVLIARDPFGITQLYYGMTSDGIIKVASEMRVLEDCISVDVVPGGHYLYFNVGVPNLTMIPYFQDTPDGSWTRITDNNLKLPYIYEPSKSPLEITSDEENLLMTQIKESFENSVIKRLMADVPFGILLSGGLDSSLVASIAVKYIREHPEIYGTNVDIHTFSIGDKDSTDLPYAQKVADFLGTKHHVIPFTVEDGMNAIETIINNLETYDITTIRASTPHYLLAQKIQSLGIKMVLSGEGSDEILGGYLYFHQAPSDEEHQLECKRRVLDLGYFDCLRADKSTMSNSLELRVPFLCSKFVKLCINIHKDIKSQKGIEKYILRKAFDINNNNNNNHNNTDNPIYLPADVLWRQKEQFSDSITYRWIDTLRTYTDNEVKEKSLVAFNHRKLLYPYNTPQTTEAFYYRQIFERLFPNREKTVKCWAPNMTWKGIQSSDPSGRVQACHINTTA